REAVHVECGEKGFPGIAAGDGRIRDDRYATFDVFIENEVLSDQFAKGLGDIENVSIRKVEVRDDLFAAFSGFGVDLECGDIVSRDHATGRAAADLNRSSIGS